MKYSLFFYLTGVMLITAGCSSFDPFRIKQPEARSIPVIPEIKRQTVVRPRYTPKKVTKRPQIKKPKPKKRQTKIITEEEQTAARELFKTQAKEKATVDIDPYASIPDNSSSNDSSMEAESNDSPVVESLLTAARADLTIGKSQAAINKLERGLRIESSNPQLWHQLARAHYAHGSYQQTINMAKKSNAYTNKNELISLNWQLVKQAGEKSGNSTAVKEALDYIKLNP